MKKQRVLILCTGNSARSQMAEALLRHDAGDRYDVFSAGVKPSRVRPEAVAVMRELGIDLSGHHSKHVDDFAGQKFDYVLTVCDNARESCPIFPGTTAVIHKSFVDPAAACGSEAERMKLFRQVRDQIREYLRTFPQGRALTADRRAGQRPYNSAMSKSWKTRLIHSDVKIPEGYRSLASPVFRGSTTLFPDAASVEDSWDQHEVGYSYGLYGTPTTLELAGKICELEKGYRTIITPGGQGAISLIHFAFLKSGDYILIPESVYTPHRKLAYHVLRRFGVEAGFYPPEIGAGIKDLLRENTRLVWCESPGSITMEVQDVPAIAEAARARGALVAMDNTWSAGVYFDAFAHGVDITMQALTKYVGGHSDLLMGSVTVTDPKLYQQMGATHQLLGNAASPDDCSLALRGMRSMAVRLKHIEASALQTARWLAARPEIHRVLHPALEASPGHEIWKRDFTGSAGVFSIVFKPEATKAQVQAFVDGLELFEIGYSWGGVTSLAVAYDFQRSKNRPDYGHRIVRLNIGLEDTEDLLQDLEQSLRSSKEGG